MPFVKKTNAKDEQRPTEARKIFIGRTEELHFFREHILKPEDPAYNIVSVSGQGGVGKSMLLLRFIDDSHATDFKEYCMAALVNERQATAADVMETFADQLHLEGDFEKALKQYKEVLHKLQSQREAARESLARQLTTDVAGSVVKDVPFVGGILKEGVEAATSYLFDELRYRQLLKDTERLEDPLSDLTRAFVVELNRLTETQVTISSMRVKRQLRVLLFFPRIAQRAGNLWQSSLNMCLFERKEPMYSHQGGTYEQYRRWIGNHPDLFGVCSLNPVLVWRGRAADGTPSQA